MRGWLILERGSASKRIRGDAKTHKEMMKIINGVLLVTVANIIVHHNQLLCQNVSVQNREIFNVSILYTASYRKNLKLEDGLASDELLGDDAGDADHGEAAVVELLGANSIECIGVSGLEAKRIEAKVAVDVVGLELGDTGSALVGVDRGLPADDNVLALNQRDDEHDDLPEVAEDGVSLLELVDSRARDLAVKQGVEVLADKDADEGKHGNAAVLELSLAELLDLTSSSARSKGERIEVTKRLQCTLVRWNIQHDIRHLQQWNQ